MPSTTTTTALDSNSLLATAAAKAAAAAAAATSWEPTRQPTDLRPAPRSRRPSKATTDIDPNSAPSSPMTQKDAQLRPHSADGHSADLAGPRTPLPNTISPSAPSSSTHSTTPMVSASPILPPPPLPPKSPRHQYPSSASLLFENPPAVPHDAMQTIRGSATTPLSFYSSGTRSATASPFPLSSDLNRSTLSTDTAHRFLRKPATGIDGVTEEAEDAESPPASSPKLHKASASYPNNVIPSRTPASAPNSPASRHASIKSNTRTYPAPGTRKSGRDHKRGPSVLMVDGQSFLLDDVKAKKKADSAAAATATTVAKEGGEDEATTPRPFDHSDPIEAVGVHNRDRSDTVTTVTMSAAGTSSTAPTSSELARTSEKQEVVPLGQEEPDDDVVGEDDKPPPGSYAIHPPTARQLSEASDCTVYDEDGKEVRFGSIFENQRTLVCFLRHWWCGFCQEFAMSLKNVDPLPLTRAGLNLIVIGQGHWHVTKAYKSVMEVPYPMYADPGRHIYKALGMSVRTNDAGPACAKPDYIQMGMTKSIMVAIKKGLLDMPIRAPGDMKLLGGEFILGPGQTCSFTHRMVTTRGHLDLPRILLQAGCDLTLRTPRQIGDEHSPSSRSLRTSRSSRLLRSKIGDADSVPTRKEKKSKKKVSHPPVSLHNGRSSVSTDYGRELDAYSIAESNSSAPGMGSRFAKGFLARRKSGADAPESLRSTSGSDWEPVPAIPANYTNGIVKGSETEAARYKTQQTNSHLDGSAGKKSSIFSSKRFRKLASGLSVPGDRNTESAPTSRASSVRSAAPEVLRPAELRQLWATQARGASEGTGAPSRMSSSNSFRSASVVSGMSGSASGASSFGRNSVGQPSIRERRRGTREGVEALGYEYDSASSDSDQEESEAESVYEQARNALRRGSAVGVEEEEGTEKKGKGYGKGSRSATDLTTPEHAKSLMMAEAAKNPMPALSSVSPPVRLSEASEEKTPVLRNDEPLPNEEGSAAAGNSAEENEAMTPRAKQAPLPEPEGPQPQGSVTEDPVPSAGRRGSIKDLTSAALASASTATNAAFSSASSATKAALVSVAAKGATALRAHKQPAEEGELNGDASTGTTNGEANHQTMPPAAPSSKKSFHLRSSSGSSSIRNRSLSLGSSGLGTFHMPRRKSKAGPPVPDKDVHDSWAVDERAEMRQQFESRINGGDGLLKPDDAEHTAPSSDLHAPNSAVHAAMIAAVNRQPGEEDAEGETGAPSSFFVDGLDAFDALPGTRPRKTEYWLEEESNDEADLPDVSGPVSPAPDADSEWDDRSVTDGGELSIRDDEEDLERYTFDEVRPSRRAGDSGDESESAEETTPPSSTASGIIKPIGGPTPILETKIPEEDEDAITEEEGDVPEDVTEDEEYDEDDDEVATIEAAHHVGSAIPKAALVPAVEPSTLHYDDESSEEEMSDNSSDLLPGASLSNAMRRRGTTGLLSPSRLSVFTEEDEDEVRSMRTESRLSRQSGTDIDEEEAEEARDALAPLETEAPYSHEDTERPLRLLKAERRKSDDAVHPSVLNALNRLVASGGNVDSVGLFGGGFDEGLQAPEEQQAVPKVNGHLAAEEPIGGRSRKGSLSLAHQFDDAEEDEVDDDGDGRTLSEVDEDAGGQTETETETQSDAETEDYGGQHATRKYSYDDETGTETDGASFVSTSWDREREWRDDAPPDAADNFFS